MAQDKLDELKSILIGDELRRFDTKFMEFGDKLQRIAQHAEGGGADKARQYTDEQTARLEERMSDMQTKMKEGFGKIIDTINTQFKKIEGDIARNEKEVESMRKKFEAFKQLFADR